MASAALVWQSTQAAFSATTGNQDNAFGAGRVTLTDNDSGSAMFTVPDLAPGDTGNACIEVTYGGNLAADVKLYTSNYSETDGAADTVTLDNHLSMRIEQGSGSSCASPGTYSDLAGGSPGTLIDTIRTARTNYANGYAAWSPTGSSSETRPYRFTYTLSAATPNTAQGDGLEIDFNWEAQNT
ncbi:TasA family protein [Pilimelia anulata]|uniref:TasA family protein n=1 Tax=Pilimelia anulata TaxID=53371 RepID=UPI001666DA23|nr:TasA family protein [Pilimelia anulata]